MRSSSCYGSVIWIPWLSGLSLIMIDVTDIDDLLRSRLTPEQYGAATDPGASILALACAGSGKSRTLAYRVAWLLANGAPADSIVAFTFTEKAADSIKLRIGQALRAADLEPTALGAMFIGTIHGYCKDLLGDVDARYRQFEVLDDNRLKLYLISRYSQLGLWDLQDAGRGRYFEVVRQVANAWTLLNDELLSVDDVEVWDADLARVLRNIDEGLDRDCFIDFSLMIRRVVDALQAGEAAAVAALARLRHLHVDEYQDVNPAQEALIERMSASAQTVMVLGDDDQALYAWRGADVTNILEFSDRHQGTSEHTLATNFRSTPAIVAAADAFVVAELGPARMEKNPQAEPFDGPRDLRRLWFDDRAEEAAWVAERIAALLGSAYVEKIGRTRGLTPADFAILMRSTRMGEQSGPPRHAAFTSALDALGIVYSLEAGGSVFDRRQVGVLRDAFELLRDASPTRAAARELFDTAIRPVYPHADFNTFVRVLGAWGRQIHGPGGATPAAGVARRRVYPQQLVHDLLDAFGLARTDFDAGTMRDVGSFSRMIQDAETVYLSIDSTARFRQILNFLQQIAEDGYDTSTDELLARPDAVTVATVHKVKGLEFPCVIVADVEAQRFPKRRSSYRGWLPTQVVADALARFAYQSTPEEEARLFYTALTRAERYLYVTGCRELPGARSDKRQSPYALRLVGAELSDEPTGLPDGLTDATPERRIEETILPTTYSDIRYYLRCPHDYLLRKRFGFSPPITDMFGFGLTVHASLAKLHEQFPDRSPTTDEARQVAEEVFHLKHVPPSGRPDTNPGPYERARDAAGSIASTYVDSYGDDFARTRKVEARFEIPLDEAVISGSIDLMLREDAQGTVLDAEVVDFKSMEGGEDPEINEELEWTDLVLQVQLYAKAAREVLGENARTGHVHLLKDNQRVSVAVDDHAVQAAVDNVEWAVKRIIAEDFPMRPSITKCAGCDFQALCPKRVEDFTTADRPPALSIPAEAAGRLVSAFDDPQS
jgi:DNA helicase II / ATP-dependent DNA helicase PcrA